MPPGKNGKNNLGTELPDESSTELPHRYLKDDVVYRKRYWGSPLPPSNLKVIDFTFAVSEESPGGSPE